MNVITKTTLSVSHLLIFTGCFSVPQQGMELISNHNERFNKSEILVNLHKNSLLERNEIEDLSETEINTDYEKENSVLRRRKKEKLDVKKLISDGNSYITEVEKDFYEPLSQEKDLESTLDMIWNECFDTSLKIEKTKITGVCKGIGIDKKPIFFADKNVGRVNVSSERGLLYFDGNMEDGIEAKLTDTLLSGIQPLELQTSDINKIRECIKKIMKDSVGNRLILILAKYLARDNKYEKIKLVKTQDKALRFEYTTGDNLWEYCELEEGIRNTLDKQSPKHKFFVFSSNWLNKDNETLFMRLNGKNKKEINGNDFTINWEKSHKEIDVLKAMIQSRHPNIKKDMKRCENVKKIVRKGSWQFRFAPEGEWLPLNEVSMHRFIFSNDEMLRTIFGITPKGLDLMNTTTYSVHKYGGIEFANINGKQKCFFKKRRSDQGEFIPITINKKKIGWLFFAFLNSSAVNHEFFRYHLSNRFMRNLENRSSCSKNAEIRGKYKKI